MLGAICPSAEARDRVANRAASAAGAPMPAMHRFDWPLAHAPDGAGDRAVSGFLHASSSSAARARHAGEADLEIALHGHLLLDDGRRCIEGAEAVAQIASLYRAAGAAGFARLSGNFALALVDLRVGVWLVRDVAGTKPLFLARALPPDGGIVFGTSALSVARAAHGRARGDAEALPQYLRSGHAPLAQRTLLAGVVPVPAGVALRIDGRGMVESIDQRPVPHRDASSGLDVASGASRLRELLLGVVAAQSESVGSACALSGGLDSSSILAAMHAARARAPRCFGFRHGRSDLPPAWDEYAFAQLAVERCSADATFVHLAADALPKLLQEVSAAHDFPFGSPVVLAQAHLFRVAAAQGVDRILSGHGPDSLFGGGTSHLIARSADLLGAARVPSALRLLAGGRRYHDVPVARLFAAALAQCLRASPGATSVHLPTWLHADAAESAHGEPRSRIALDRVTGVMQSQLHESVVQVSLLTEECNARAAGIENRLPYLVREIVELAFALAPAAILPPDGETKSLLRRAMAADLPAAILARKRAIGFAVPALPWLLERSDWVRDRIEALRRWPLYSGPDAPTLMASLQRRDASSWRHAFLAWRWIVLAAWREAHDVAFD